MIHLPGLRAVLLLAAVAGVFATSASAAGRTADGSRIKSCGSVSGAKWIWPNTAGKINGNTYGVTVVGVSCTIAKAYVIKLSKAKLPGKAAAHSYPLAGGPKGYTCHASPDALGKVLSGSCQLNPQHVFFWTAEI